MDIILILFFLLSPLQDDVVCYPSKREIYTLMNEGYKLDNIKKSDKGRFFTFATDGGDWIEFSLYMENNKSYLCERAYGSEYKVFTEEKI